MRCFDRPVVKLSTRGAMERPICALAAAVALAGCAHAPTPLPAGAGGDYRLGADDLVAVEVWKEPALSATVPVRPDGKISLPMVGELPALGHTASELAQEVKQRLTPWVPEPVVTVMVKEVRAARFFVLGEVAHPGAFPLTGKLTVLEAVSLAGGATEFAHKRRMVVIRPRHGGGAERLAVDFGGVLSGKREPLPLAPGDTVYLP
jgi:polysaccharide export outer membrane protein